MVMDSDETGDCLTPSQVPKLRVRELKTELNKRGLSVSGKRNDLARRLKRALTFEDTEGIENKNLTDHEISDSLGKNANSGKNKNSGTDKIITKVLEENDKSAKKNKDFELLEKEKLLLVREIELLRRESEIFKKERDLANNKCGMRDTEKSGISDVRLLMNLIPEFSGNRDTFENWRSQVQIAIEAYNIDQNTAKMIVIGKLKGKVLTWFQSTPNHLSLSLTELFEKMAILFGTVTNKVSLRRTFESRRWNMRESFLDYFHEKNELGNKLQLEEEELIEYIIDGISDYHIRNQARMKNFKTIGELLNIMTNIPFSATTKFERGKLEKQQVTSKKFGNKEFNPKPTSTRENKCYNCGQKGHWSTDCKAPKRIWGTCFGCGGTGHKIENCPARQDSTNIQRISINPEYVVEVWFDTYLGKFALEALVDSGSPISMVTEDFADKFSIQPYKDGINYCGLNASNINILGVAVQDAEINNVKIRVKLHVVANGTLGKNCPPLLIGRNVLNNERLRTSIRDGKIIMEDKEDFLFNINIDAATNTIDKLDLNHIDVEVRNKVMNIFEKYTNVLNSVDRNNISDFGMQINLKKSEPFSSKPRRLSFKEKEELDEIIKDLLNRSIIRESSSPYCSPIVLVKKKTGEFRMCVDYRQLNKITVREHFPIPLIEEHLQLLEGKKIFSSLDLKNAYYNIRVEENSMSYTSFITPFGQYEFLRMPFGLVNAPSVFQRYITNLLRGLIAAGKISVYFDDISFGTETIEEHFEILNEVLEILGSHGLELRFDKCHIAKPTINYLGYEVNSEGIRPCESNVEAILNFPLPKNVRDVHSFIGMCSYFRKFVHNFASLAKPLYDLLKKDATFVFDDKCIESFETLKQKLVEKPVLALYSPKDETELHCDASSLGFGAILFQRKNDGKMHPVFFFSKRTTPSENKYHSFELETLAIIYALKRFRPYLHGLKFKIFTDCNSLTLTLNKKDINPRIARWALELQDYDYEVVHRDSSKMKHVDALSRAHNILVLEGNTFEQTLSLHQYRDKKIKSIRDLLEKSEHKFYELRNGLVYRKGKDQRLLFYVPDCLEENVIRNCHDYMGHFGVDKTTNLIFTNYWFPYMKRKVKEYISRCLKCLTFQPISGKPQGELHSIPKKEVPFDTIHIDHFGPLEKTKERFAFVFVVIDAFTRYVRLYPTRTTNSLEAIRCLREYFRSLSRPIRIVSDRGSGFTSREFREFCEECNIKHILVATGCPQANGLVERVNRVLKPALAKLVDKERKLDWGNVLEDVEFAINNTRNRSTGESPSKILFGTEQRGKFVDTLRQFLEGELDNLGSRKNFENIRARVAIKNQKVQDYNENYYNLRHRKPQIYKLGDLVNIVNVDTTIGMNKKLIPKFRGPFVITKILGNDRYLIEDPEGYQNTSRPFKGVFSSSQMKHYKLA